MEKLLLSIPSLYGDHHTSAVRTILGGLEGISEIFASPAAKQVVLAYDPKVVQPETIQAALAEHGYAVGAEEPVYPISQTEVPTRHTAAVQTAGPALTFRQSAPSWQGRPLWPCPGLSYQTHDES
jgi:copper chaperone CopZ